MCSRSRPVVMRRTKHLKYFPGGSDVTLALARESLVQSFTTICRGMGKVGFPRALPRSVAGWAECGLRGEVSVYVTVEQNEECHVLESPSIVCYKS